MLKKSNLLLIGGLLTAAGELIARLDAHPVGAAIFAVTVVLIAAIDAWASIRKKR